MFARVALIGVTFAAAGCGGAAKAATSENAAASERAPSSERRAGADGKGTVQPTRAAGKTPPPGGPDLEAINRDSGNCVIVWRSQPCCEGYVAVRRSQMNVPTPSFDDDPDCTEGPIDSPPPSPPSCHRGRIPTGVEETANGLCRLRFD